MTLPAATAASGRLYNVKKTSNNHSLLLGSSTLIDGLPGLELTSTNSVYPYLQVISDGNTWRMLSRSTDGIITSSNVYLIVDVSGGPTASSYPVSYQATVPDLTGSGNLEFKTNKIVLKYILPGSFTMGNTTVGSIPEHPVVLTKGFWAGVFEVTRKQWLNVMANNPDTPSYTNSSNTLPMEMVSWEDLRGATANWPTSSTVESSTFLGILQAKTGLPFDLPTEAEWEYTCRAATITLWSFGSATAGDYEWDDSNSGAPREVGAKLPNPWGLYDMHGNVWELCRDWYLSPYPTSSEQVDPSGSTSGSFRVFRGGRFNGSPNLSRSANRAFQPPNFRNGYLGFRLFMRPK